MDLYKFIAAGSWHTCVILSDDTVKCWGRNGVGELGLGDTETRGNNPGEMGDSLYAVDLGAGKTAMTITAGEHHTCVILNDDTVKCWGGNWRGQLGLGDLNPRGNDPNEMGDNLYVVDFGMDKRVKAVAASRLHTCAILNDDSVKCWGDNSQAQLGLGDLNSRGDNPNEMGDNLPRVEFGSGRTAVMIAAGAHTCAILDNGQVKCWGENFGGQLGLGDTSSRGDNPYEMGDNLPAVWLW